MKTHNKMTLILISQILKVSLLQLYIIKTAILQILEPYQRIEKAIDQRLLKLKENVTELLNIIGKNR